MFRKLLKYDFRSMLKQFAFIWPAALVLAIINRFTISGIDSSSTVGETTAGVMMLVYVGIMIAMFVVTMIFIIQRFFKGLLGDEGYLMHTLPVRPWQLIGSKLLCAVITTLLSIIVAIFSILLMAPISWGHIFVDMFKGFGYLFSHWNIEFTHCILFILEFLLFLSLGMANSYLHLYLAMAIGHLFNKNRIAMSVVAYIAINAAVGVLFSLFGSTFLRFNPFDFLNYMDFSAFTVHLSLWTAILFVSAGNAVYFFCTDYILRKKLNLE